LVLASTKPYPSLSSFATGSNCLVHPRESSLFSLKRHGKRRDSLRLNWLIYPQEGKASSILSKYHANGDDARDPLVMLELAQIRHALRMEEEMNKGTSYFSLFSSKGNRRRMRIIIAIAMFSQWRSVSAINLI